MINDNYVRAAKVVNVVDGDTIDVVIDLGFDINYKRRIRIRRINSPEKTGLTKEAGLAAKAFAEARLLNKEVSLQSYKYDPRLFKVDSTGGRYLAEVLYINEQGEQINYSDEALAAGQAILFMDKY